MVLLASMSLYSKKYWKEKYDRVSTKTKVCIIDPLLISCPFTVTSKVNWSSLCRPVLCKCLNYYICITIFILTLLEDSSSDALFQSVFYAPLEEAQHNSATLNLKPRVSKHVQFLSPRAGYTGTTLVGPRSRATRRMRKYMGSPVVTSFNRAFSPVFESFRKAGERVWSPDRTPHPTIHHFEPSPDQIFGELVTYAAPLIGDIEISEEVRKSGYSKLETLLGGKVTSREELDRLILEHLVMCFEFSEETESESENESEMDVESNDEKPRVEKGDAHLQMGLCMHDGADRMKENLVLDVIEPQEHMDMDVPTSFSSSCSTKFVLSANMGPKYIRPGTGSTSTYDDVEFLQ